MVEGFVFVREKLFEFLEVFFPVPAVDGEGPVGFDGVDEQRGSTIALGLAEELRPNAAGGVFLAIDGPEFGTDLEFPNDVKHGPIMNEELRMRNVRQDALLSVHLWFDLLSYRRIN